MAITRKNVKDIGDFDHFIYVKMELRSLINRQTREYLIYNPSLGLNGIIGSYSILHCKSIAPDRIAGGGYFLYDDILEVMTDRQYMKMRAK